MKHLTITSLLVVALAIPVFAADPAPAPKPADAKKPIVEVKKDLVEKTGLVEIEKGKSPKHPIVTLKVEKESFILAAGKDAKILEEIVKLAGKEITVKGQLLIGEGKHPMPLIKVESFSAKTVDAAAPAAKDAVTEPAKDAVKDADKELAKDAVKDADKELAKDTVKDATKDPVTEPAKEAPKTNK
ncbi:MAG: hypothetical protein WA705_15400 [Candidatus Ozemobacteraceae bacterium]